MVNVPDVMQAEWQFLLNWGLKPDTVEQLMHDTDMRRYFYQTCVAVRDSMRDSIG